MNIIEYSQEAPKKLDNLQEAAIAVLLLSNSEEDQEDILTRLQEHDYNTKDLDIPTNYEDAHSYSLAIRSAFISTILHPESFNEHILERVILPITKWYSEDLNDMRIMIERGLLIKDIAGYMLRMYGSNDDKKNPSVYADKLFHTQEYMYPTDFDEDYEYWTMVLSD